MDVCTHTSTYTFLKDWPQRPGTSLSSVFAAWVLVFFKKKKLIIYTYIFSYIIVYPKVLPPPHHPWSSWSLMLILPLILPSPSFSVWFSSVTSLLVLTFSCFFICFPYIPHLGFLSYMVLCSRQLPEGHFYPLQSSPKLICFSDMLLHLFHFPLLLPVLTLWF